MKHNTFILLLAVLIMGTMSTLAWVERSQSSPVNDKDWWALSYVSPSPSATVFDFVIENFSSSERFEYRVDSATYTASDVILVPAGERSVVALPDDLVSPVTITVQSSTDEKTLYK